MVRSYSRTLPATLGMKNNKFDVVLGQNNHHGELTPIGLTAAERERHVFIEGDELLREKDLVTESVVSVFRKIFSEDDSGGHRIEYVLRNAIQTALYVKDATLFTVYDLLNDPAYRKKVLTTIDDKNLINFWKQELGKGGYIGRLKEWREGQSDRNFLYNLGIKGETTTQILRRLIAESIPRKPDLLLLTAGSNDSRRIGGKKRPMKATDEEFQANVLAMIQQGKALCDVVFIGTHPFDEARTTPFSYWNKNNYYLLDDQKRRERMVAEICRQEEVPFLDLFSDWFEKDYLQWLHEDGQHANSSGHDLIFKQLKEFLQKLYTS